MGDFGLTDAGFVRKTGLIIEDELIEDFQAIPGFEDIKTEPGSGFGQIIGIMGEQFAQLWELAEEVTFSQFRTTATGNSLNQALANVGQAKLGAEKSRVALTLKSIETAPVNIAEGRLVSQSANAVQWQTTADATIPAATGTVLSALAVSAIAWQSGTTVRYTFSGAPSLSGVAVGDLLIVAGAANPVNNGSFFITAKNDPGDWVEVTNKARTSSSGNEAGGTVTADIKNVATVLVDAESIYAGEYKASVGTIDTIITPVFGWLAVTNEVEAIAGRNEETDTEARLRSEDTLSISKGGTVEAVQSRLINEVPGVTYANYNENRTPTTDMNGLPPHSFEMIVVGGTNSAVAAMILKAKPLGIETYGDITVSVPNAISGGNTPTSFSRVLTVSIYLIVNLTTDANYPADGDDQVKAALIDYFNTLEHGEDVLNYKLINSIAEIPGILTIEILQGTAPTPVTSTNLTIAPGGLATLSDADITVNS